VSISQAVFSGIIQGVTEFLPVSSSGHLVLLHHYFGYKQPQLLFDIFLHVGTLFAVLVYFKRDIQLLFTKERRFLSLILIGCVPTAIIGFAFEYFFREAFMNIKLVSVMLIVTALFLFGADYITRLREKSKDTNLKPLGVGKALIIGAMQGLAILPGISRSGTTISTALICRINKEEAIRYSFLLAIPAIVGALVFELRNFDSIKTVLIPQVVAGALSAFLVGLVAIYYLIKAVIKKKLFLFGIYCLITGSAIFFRA